MEKIDTNQAVKRIETALGRGERPPIIAVIGEDEYLVSLLSRRFYSDLLMTGGDISSEQFNADDLSPQKLSISLNTMSLFATMQTIWIKGLKPSGKGHVELAGILLEWLSAFEQRKAAKRPAIIVSWNGKANSNSKLYDKITSLGYVVEIPSMDTYNPGDPERDPTYPWVQKLAQEQGKSLDIPAFQLLRQRVDGDLWSLKTEIDKLAAYCLERGVITHDDVRSVVPESRTEVIFELMDAMVEKDTPRTLGIFHSLLTSGTYILAIVKLLHRQVRYMLQAHGLIMEGIITAGSAQQKYFQFQREVVPKLTAWSEQHGIDRKNWFFGLHPFLIQRLLNQVAKFNVEDLIAMLLGLKEVDLAAKSGGASPDCMLEQILISITRSKGATHGRRR